MFHQYITLVTNTIITSTYILNSGRKIQVPSVRVALTKKKQKTHNKIIYEKSSYNCFGRCSR